MSAKTSHESDNIFTPVEDKIFLTSAHKCFLRKCTDEKTGPKFNHFISEGGILGIPS